jgi:stress-induced-phosphoprotein 1
MYPPRFPYLDYFHILGSTDTQAETTKAEKERLAYIDQDKADEERERGNALFKNGDYPAAVKSYSEAIKRAPQDPRGYGNRAAAYIKLASFPDAIKVKSDSSHNAI